MDAIPKECIYIIFSFTERCLYYKFLHLSSEARALLLDFVSENKNVLKELVYSATRGENIYGNSNPGLSYQEFFDDATIKKTIRIELLINTTLVHMLGHDSLYACDFVVIWASRSGLLDVVKHMLNVYYQSKSESNSVCINRCIVAASKNNRLSVLKVLLVNTNADPSFHNNEAIRVAVRENHTEVVQLLLLDQRVDPSDNFNEAIKHACSKSTVSMIDVLLGDKRVDPGCEDNVCIREAATLNRIAVFKVLMKDRRVNPYCCYNEVCENASRNGNKRIVELLLKEKKIKRGAIKRCIKQASSRNHTDVLELLKNYKRRERRCLIS